MKDSVAPALAFFGFIFANALTGDATLSVGVAILMVVLMVPFYNFNGVSDA